MVQDQCNKWEGIGDWETSKLRSAFRNFRRHCMPKRRQNPSIGSICCTTRFIGRTYSNTLGEAARLTRVPQARPGHGSRTTNHHAKFPCLNRNRHFARADRCHKLRRCGNRQADSVNRSGEDQTISSSKQARRLRCLSCRPGVGPTRPRQDDACEDHQVDPELEGNRIGRGQAPDLLTTRFR